MRRRRSGGIVSLALALTASATYGQHANHEHDHVLNYRGQQRLTVTTGIPYLGIAEYAYGISDRLTAGVFAGATPNVGAVGARVRTVVAESDSGFRIYYCTPLVFYPKTKGLGGDPWWLIRPNINFEWVTASGFRYKVGGGLVAAASHHTLFGDGSRARFDPGVWNTVHAGFSVPIGPEVTFQLESSLVMSGLRPAGSDWVGGPPVILIMGTSWTF